MALINKAINEMTLKIVYYGPGLCGKTTNLQYIHKKSNPQKRGKLLSIATESDRTLFFDLLPMEVGNIKGMKVRLQLYTVPGQVFYDATRRLVLKGADGVVFVADSQRAMKDANIESINNLKTNLRVNNLDPDKIPLVFQFNKRDLNDVLSTEEMTEDIIYRKGHKGFPACALSGKGVHETLKQIVTEVLKNITKGVSHDLDNKTKKVEVIEEFKPEPPAVEEKMPEVMEMPKAPQQDLPEIDDTPFDEPASVPEPPSHLPAPEIGSDIFDDDSVQPEPMEVQDLTEDDNLDEYDSEKEEWENEPVAEPEELEEAETVPQLSDNSETVTELDALYEQNRNNISNLEQLIRDIKSQQEKIVTLMAKYDNQQ